MRGRSWQDAKNPAAALVHAADQGGGAEACAFSLLQHLRKRDVDASMFVSVKRTPDENVQEIPYVRGIPGSRRLARWVESRKGRQAVYEPSFSRLCAKLSARFDVVHFHSLWNRGMYADLHALPRLSKKTPVVLTLHDSWLFTGHCACFFDCDRWRSGCGNCPDLSFEPPLEVDGTGWNWQYKRKILQNSRVHVVCVSDWLAAAAAQSPIFEHKPVSRIYNGIDCSVFRPSGSADRDMLRREVGLEPGQFAVLLTGQSIKWFDRGIGAQGFEAVNAARVRNLVPVVLGTDDRRVAASMNRPSILLPFETDRHRLAAIYSMVDMTLVTSEFETFGRIAAESQACETPVVSYNSGGLGEVVKEGVGGMSVRRGDIQGLVDGIRALASDEARRVRLGRTGRDYVIRHFSEEKTTQEYIALYHHEIETRSRQAGHGV